MSRKGRPQCFLKWAFIAITYILIFTGKSLYADELKPTLIQVEQHSQTDWIVIWKQSKWSTNAGKLRLRYPDGCLEKGGWKRTTHNELKVKTVRIRCTDGVWNKKFELEGLQNTQIDALLRLKSTDKSPITAHLTRKKPSFTTPDLSDQAAKNSFLSYLALGFTHILEGTDHVLFIICLTLLIPGWKKLTITITAFTIAHSITLAANTLGWVTLNPKPVEAIIALSIIFLAKELQSSNRKRATSITQNQPWLVVFLFGLVHGLGFAGALEQIGLPDQDVATALIGFNIGVELGQLMIVIATLLTFNIFKLFNNNGSTALINFVAYSVGSISTFWLIERIFF